MRLFTFEYEGNIEEIQAPNILQAISQYMGASADIEVSLFGNGWITNCWIGDQLVIIKDVSGMQNDTVDAIQNDLNALAKNYSE